MTVSMLRMEMCCEIGKLVSARPEKGAAVAGAYLENALDLATETCYTEENHAVNKDQRKGSI